MSGNKQTQKPEEMHIVVADKVQFGEPRKKQ